MRRITARRIVALMKNLQFARIFIGQQSCYPGCSPGRLTSLEFKLPVSPTGTTALPFPAVIRTPDVYLRPEAFFQGELHLRSLSHEAAENRLGEESSDALRQS